MNRRDFLLLRSEEDLQLAELSCQKLFVLYSGLNSGFHEAEAEEGTIDDADWWAGEPPLLIHSIDPDEFFSSVMQDLKGVDSLTVLDMEWVAQGDFRIRVETLLAAVRARGVEVVFQLGETKPAQQNLESSQSSLGSTA
jgi:hypothetical protein|tara:strand:+ start:247 stop:663 length:417 start_codon:yes stop_codon:yes gene_type:complete